MNRDIFISYSRRDTEFVLRLASDLHDKVAGVWFDQSTIQVGQKWRDEIMDGVRECKVFVLVLSPDAAESQYVREEVNKALELGKTIIPILYRPVKLTGQLQALVAETQYLDLQTGSYTANFRKLVDGIIAAGAVGQNAETLNAKRSLIREEVKTDWGAVLRKVPGWGCSWSIGWVIFAVGLLIFLIVTTLNSGPSDSSSSNTIQTLIVILGASGLGGFIGGLCAGLLTMLVLRAYAVSISWKHMWPAIRIWALSGPLGMILSGLLTAVLVTFEAITMNSTDCSNLDFKTCFSQSLGDLFSYFAAVALVYLALTVAIWFVTGLFAGGLAVRHIRKLEPGITKGQGRGVAVSWGCGAIVAVFICIAALAIAASLAS